MSDILFKIRNLKCRYGSKTVLQINELDIPRNKLTFLIGASGVGKSTLLETLGLMNDTFHGEESKIEFYPDVKGDTVNYARLNYSSDSQKSLIRKKYFSFIFQETNLMPNFTAYENVCLTQMLQGVSFEKAYPNAKKIMHEIGLGEVVVNKGTMPYSLSGGQKQRLAFARAVSSDYTVLLGDEPTGNLDNANAVDLLNFLVLHQKSTIIVSHDISLTLKYADQIVLLTKQNGYDYAEAKRENIFIQKKDKQTGKWYNLNGEVYELENLIMESFDASKHE